MACLAMGIGTIIVVLGYGTRSMILTRQAQLRRLAQLARPIMGALFVLVGAMILLGVNILIERWLLDHLPYWLQDFSVIL